MAIPASATSMLGFAALGSVVLRQSDNDTARRWGGVAHAGTSGTSVADLQRALTAVGVYTSTIDGDFGGGTLLAVRKFQWFVLNSRFRLKVAAGASASTGSVVGYPAAGVAAVTGQCDAALAGELLAWVAGEFRTTSLLVRVKTARFATIARAPTFTTLGYPDAADDEVLVSGSFGGLDILEAVAGAERATLRLNQTFRVQGIAPTGAVVAPATRSQHLIGHAVDLNIVTTSGIVTSAMFTAGQAPRQARDVVAGAKRAGLRWGGDFGNTDPPHFDQPVSAASDDYDMHFFFCQRPYVLRHPIRLL